MSTWEMCRGNGMRSSIHSSPAFSDDTSQPCLISPYRGHTSGSPRICDACHARSAQESSSHSEKSKQWAPHRLNCDDASITSAAHWMMIGTWNTSSILAPRTDTTLPSSSVVSSYWYSFPTFGHLVTRKYVSGLNEPSGSDASSCTTACVSGNVGPPAPPPSASSTTPAPATPDGASLTASTSMVMVPSGPASAPESHRYLTVANSSPYSSRSGAYKSRPPACDTM
mmetsp:Transcript_5184/g.18626  ORF Transcript_5184/g.18626 Transcript_5184/m.18626 type:complete len:226 (+) Transcript_5184:323-1000(+)